MGTHLIKSELQHFRSIFKIKKAFDYIQFVIEVPNEGYNKFSELASLFLVQKIPDYNITEEMDMYKNSRRSQKVTRCY